MCRSECVHLYLHRNPLQRHSKLHLPSKALGPQDTVRQRTLSSGASLFAFQLKPEDIVGRHVLQKEAADGTRSRAKILELVEELEGQRDSQPERVKFKARIGTSNFEKLN